MLVASAVQLSANADRPGVKLVAVKPVADATMVANAWSVATWMSTPARLLVTAPQVKLGAVSMPVVPVICRDRRRAGERRPQVHRHAGLVGHADVPETVM